MDTQFAELVWRGIGEANPWWSTGAVPSARTRPLRRESFDDVFQGFFRAEPGRGVVALGPRRVGKTVIVHQAVEALLDRGVEPKRILLLTLDDVALRGQDLGTLLALVDERLPLPPECHRFLLLDEVQHSAEWSGWLKRIADRRDPYTFLATGSSATALKRGGQDQGLGRWQEVVLFPWSFREHVRLRGVDAWTFETADRLRAEAPSGAALAELLVNAGPIPVSESERLDRALTDYLLRGGFPEVAETDDLVEARRRLRQDILDRALGRDIQDVAPVNSSQLETMFLRICLNPGGLWNESEVARDIKASRPTVARYLKLLEEAFLAFRLPNAASPVKGQPKVFLVAPALRQALLNLEAIDIQRPTEWGMLAENAVTSHVIGHLRPGADAAFWRQARDECDVIVREPGEPSTFIEVKRSGKKALRGIERAGADLKTAGVGWVLGRRTESGPLVVRGETRIQRLPAAAWLYIDGRHGR